MKNSILGIILVIIVIVAGYFILREKPQDTGFDQDNQNRTQNKSIINYTSILSSELEIMLDNKDFVLIDVHIPEQEHIVDTDYFIDFNNIDKIVSVLPDKDEKVVLYCRSGSMSKTAAKELIERGYTNVFDLTHGLKEWKAQDGSTTEIGSVESL